MTTPAPRRLGRLALVAGLLLAGCRGPDLEARVVELEVQLARVERRADDAAGLEPRVRALEAQLATPPPRDVDLVARVAALEAQVESLRAAARGEPRSLDPGSPPDHPAADGPITIPRAPPGTGAAPPPAGTPVEVLSAGSGGLLLVRQGETLHRVALVGVDAPERTEAYAGDPALRARHAAAFGADALQGDRLFEESRRHLEQLVQGGVVSLSYGEGPRLVEGSVRATVTVTPAGGAPVDVNQAMVKDGFALAAPDAPADLRSLEDAAREAHLGLFAPGGSGR
jgi:endonuclease YncB( thermonuclease family)